MLKFHKKFFSTNITPPYCARGKLPMYSLNARDHFNCSPLLFSRPVPQNRCSETERGGRVVKLVAVTYQAN